MKTAFHKTAIMANKQSINGDEMLAKAGDFGKFQWLLMALFSFINILSAFHYFGQTFISIVPGHKCSTKNDTNSDYFHQHPCQKLFYNVTNREHLEAVCNDWQYNSSYGYISIVQQLNWVCESDWKPVMGQSFFFIGTVLGSLLFGMLADRIGRLHVLVFSNLLAFVGNICTLFSKSIVSFSLSRFIAGSATDTNFVMMYIIVMEYMRPSLRTFGLNLCIGVFYCAACMAVPWVAVFSGNWHYFLLFVSIPHLLVLVYYFIVPESAQWLVSKGRLDKALKCFEHIAKTNGRQIDQQSKDELLAYAKEHIQNVDRNVSFLNLFKTPKLRRKTLILFFKSMVITLCYDAISRDVNGLGFNPFVIFTISSTTILPACILILLLQDRIGRKALATGSLMVSGIFTITAAFIIAFFNEPDAFLCATLAVVSRFGINIAYNSGCQYAVELIPTEVRGQGVAAIHVAGYAATFFSSYILYFSTYWKPASSVILGILLILGAGVCLLLPETLNKTLPVTLEDGETFGEDEELFEFSCCSRKKIVDDFRHT